MPPLHDLGTLVLSSINNTSVVEYGTLITTIFVVISANGQRLVQFLQR